MLCEIPSYRFNVIIHRMELWTTFPGHCAQRAETVLDLV